MLTRCIRGITGRGAMKYLDPETINRQQLPQNFNIRGGRGRGDLPPPRGGSFRDRDRDRERYGDRDGGQERRDRREQRGDRGDHDRGYPSSYSRSDPYSRRTRDPLDRYPRPTGRENGQEDRRTKLDRDMDQWQHDRSQGLDVRGERDKFRRGERDEPERDREEKREEKKEEGEMTPRDEKERSSGLEREDRVERAMSEGSDMVMDRDD